MRTSTTTIRPCSRALNIVVGAIVCFLVFSLALAVGALVTMRLNQLDPRPWLFYGGPLAVAVLAFLLRSYGWCNWKHVLLSLVPSILVCVLVVNRVWGISFSEPEMYIAVGILSVTIVVPGNVGMAVGRWVHSRETPRKARGLVLLAAAALILCSVLMHSLVWKAIAWRTRSHAAIAGPPVIRCNATDLQRTVVVPTLDYPIREGTNVLWCASIQLAWNELVEAAGGPLKANNDDRIINALNRQDITAQDLDASTYVALAGPVDEVLPKIREQLSQKFEGQASSIMLPADGELPNDGLFAYCYLFNNMPFKWAFERIPRAMLFGDDKVECFGIEQYTPSDKKERMSGSQLVVWDYGASSNFVIELKTRRSDHHLILARVAPRGTLGETVNAVFQRIENGVPGSIGEADNLFVPVLSFDIVRDYSELCGQSLSAEGASPFRAPLLQCRQQIRFRLDEKGALLKSEAMYHLCKGRHFCFDRAFLILLRYKEAHRPYLAMWADNAEILVQSTKSTGYEEYEDKE